jgi:hypothetical protein
MPPPVESSSYTYPTTQAERKVSVGHVQVQSLREWQIQLADYLIANPQPTLRELSAHFRRTPAWISSVIHTDAFKAYLAQRRKELNQSLDAEGGHLQTMKEKLESTVHLALDELSYRLGDPTLGMTVPTKDVTRAAEVALRALGFGPAQGNAPAQVNVENNVFVLTREQLEAARAKRQALVAGGASTQVEEEAKYLVTYQPDNGERELSSRVRLNSSSKPNPADEAAAGVYTEWGN